MQTFRLLVTTCFLFFIASCGKEGPQGPEGAQGNPGPQGPKGEVGTANVIYSSWLTPTAARDSTIDYSKLKVAYIPAPRLTADMLSNAAIMVYMDFGVVVPLPYTNAAAGRLNTMSFIPAIGRICITRFSHDNSGLMSMPTSIKYRYIIIPGSISGRHARPEVDLFDYKAVCAYYNIPE